MERGASLQNFKICVARGMHGSGPKLMFCLLLSHEIWTGVVKEGRLLLAGTSDACQQNPLAMSPDHDQADKHAGRQSL